ncbi:MAG: hypothetical protein ACK4OK_01110, partial [Thermoflexus sp.]
MNRIVIYPDHAVLVRYEPSVEISPEEISLDEAAGEPRWAGEMITVIADVNLAVNPKITGAISLHQHLLNGPCGSSHPTVLQPQDPR